MKPSIRLPAGAVLLSLGAMVTAACSSGLPDLGDVARNVGCAALEALPADRMEATFAAAAETLAESGVTLDGRALDDPSQFDAFFAALNTLVGCAVAPEVELPSFQGITTNYCGPGSGDALPTVSTCLNKLCYLHDACYYMCSAATGKTCLWAQPTHPCDDAMLAAVDACEHESGTSFRSRAVIWLAKQAYAKGGVNTCPEQPGIVCGGASGNGPCQGAVGAGDEAKAEACLAACVSAKDPEMKCFHDHECRLSTGALFSVEEAVCYTANCPAVEDCF